MEKNDCCGMGSDCTEVVGELAMLDKSSFGGRSLRATAVRQTCGCAGRADVDAEIEAVSYQTEKGNRKCICTVNVFENEFEIHSHAIFPKVERNAQPFGQSQSSAPISKFQTLLALARISSSSLAASSRSAASCAPASSSSW